jgi:hypothetical protein
MAGDEMPGQVARSDDGVIGLVGNPHLAQLALHRIGRARRIGDEDDGAALAAKRMQRLAGFGEGFQPIMNHAPDIGEHDLHATHEVAQLFDKGQRRHDRTYRSARAGGAARQRGIA